MVTFLDRTGRHTLNYVYGATADSKITVISEATPFGLREVANWGADPEAYLSVTDNLTDFNFGTGDFCLEFLGKFTNTPSVLDIYVPTQAAWQAWFQPSGEDKKLSLYWGTGGPVSAILPSINTYHSYCIDRAAGILRIFIDGVKVTEVANTVNFTAVGVTPFAIGAQVASRNNQPDAGA